MKVIASSIRKGNIIEQDGKLYVVLTAENIHPGKGTPVSQIEMRRISDGTKVSERYKTTDQVERAFVEDRDFNYLYEDGDGFHFMNNENYDQFVMPKEVLGDAMLYLRPNTQTIALMYNGNPLSLELPGSVELTIVECPPGIKGATVTNQTKDAELETGLKVRVPGFIENGETIRVSTADGSYIGRAKE